MKILVGLVWTVEIGSLVGALPHNTYLACQSWETRKVWAKFPLSSWNGVPYIICALAVCPLPTSACTDADKRICCHEKSKQSCAGGDGGMLCSLCSFSVRKVALRTVPWEFGGFGLHMHFTDFTSFRPH
ncbi:hypothetical protein Zmor_020357 [Zophobas morio]|uniref:Secreted protein n=1 Tax=Zophobas morio TaxID=2755281 RepID=A0AA38MA79_9CUCU|nr:hypothetical protein Zmor_020357 [Zophobas morio]